METGHMLRKKVSQALDADLGRGARREKLSGPAQRNAGNNRWERPESSSRKSEVPREHFMQRWGQ